MKVIKNYTNFINEELKVLKEPTDKETNEELSKLSQYELNQLLFNNVVNNKISVIKTLIKYGADVNYNNTAGTTPLMFAARHNFIDVVKCLVENGAEISNVAIGLAMNNLNKEIVDYLFEMKKKNNK